MKRHTLSTVGVAVLVLLAGTAVLAGATGVDAERQTVDTTRSVGQQNAGNATEGVNATIETLELRNVTFTNVSVDHVHVTGTVTAGEETVLETADDAETVENVSARQLVVDGTLENVSFSELVVRNESIATALLGNRTTGDEGVTIPNATLENRTIDGIAIEHGNLGDATVEEVRTRDDAVGADSGEATSGEPAIEIHSVSVDDATIGAISAAGLSTGNETAVDETTDAGDDD